MKQEIFKKLGQKIALFTLGLLFTNFVAFGQMPSHPKFNSDTSDLPTVMVTNITKDGGCATGSGVGCWKKSINIDAGDIIAIQIYFHNSTPHLAEDGTINIQPKTSTTDTFHIFIGGVASTTIERAEGYATIVTRTLQKITFIPGTIRMYKHGDKGGYEISNEDLFFGHEGIAL